MSSDGYLTALSAVTNALFLIAGVYIYVSLIRQISTRATPADEARSFRLGEVILATVLISLFLLNLFVATSQSGQTMKTRDLAATALLSLGLFVFVAAFLKFRGLDVNALSGLSKLRFWRTLLTGGILLFAACPLILLADTLTQRIFGRGSSKQEIVELFTGSQTITQRVFIILLAVALAPLVEEFIFRFFIYGVLRQYFGRAVGIVANSLLFAAVHSHLPSFVPLFVLGSCFTIAYEWSGSILVSMTMHALFNSLTLTALAYPEIFQQ